MSLVPKKFERSQVWVQAQARIKRQDLVFWDAYCRAHFPVDRVAIRHNCIQSVVATSHLYDNQGAIVGGYGEVSTFVGHSFGTGQAATEDGWHHHASRDYQHAILDHCSA